MKPGLVILISGRGSNLQSIIDAIGSGEINADIRLVISNVPNAPGLAWTEAAGLPACVIDHRKFPDRAAFETALTAAIDEVQPRVVVLAGFMRILSDTFINHFKGRLLNIHPSLLPKYRGLDTHARALAAGEREHGASVHFVTPEVDSGPVIIQARVPVQSDDTADTLAARVLQEEHRIYPLAIRWLLEDRLSLAGDRVLLDGGRHRNQGLTPEKPRKSVNNQ
jgi:phosphoribosylglycinamide formyltransferase 1